LPPAWRGSNWRQICKRAFGDLDPTARAALLERARWGIAVAYTLAGRDVPGEPILGLEALDLLHEVEFEWQLTRYP
jgi:hypothetical protein